MFTSVQNRAQTATTASSHTPLHRLHRATSHHYYHEPLIFPALCETISNMKYLARTSVGASPYSFASVEVETSYKLHSLWMYLIDDIRYSRKWHRGHPHIVILFHFIHGCSRLATNFSLKFLPHYGHHILSMDTSITLHHRRGFNHKRPHLLPTITNDLD